MSNESLAKKEETKEKINWLNVLVAVTVAVIALVGAFISKAQTAASAASTLADNEAQQAYYQAIGLRISGEADVNNAYRTEYQLWYRYNIQHQAALKQGDAATVQTFLNLRDTVEKNSTSKIFDPAYFDRKKPSVNLALYTVDKYGHDLYKLEEEKKAAEDVSSAWDDKTGIYGLHLTLLVVAGFLLGLALMTKAKTPTRVFTVAGVSMVVLVGGWALQVSALQVFDLRRTQAITAFAEGASLIDQQRWDEALTQFNTAIAAAGQDHPYGNAFLYRAKVYLAQEKFSEAIQDYNQAIQAGQEADPTLYGDLVSAYFQMGDFDNAIQKGEAALKNTPNDLVLNQRVNMALLTRGEIDQADRQNDALIKIATELVREQQQAGDSPSGIWWTLNNAAYQYDQLSYLLKDTTSNSPIKKNVPNASVIANKATELSNRLRSAVLTLKYKLPDSSSTPAAAKIETPQFSLSTTPDRKYTTKVDMQFKYSGFTSGQLLTIVVDHNNIEEPAWGLTQEWSSRNSNGTTQVTLSPTYDSLYIVPPGLYVVDIYLNANLLSSGEFTVDDPNTPGVDTFANTFTSFDMLDQYDTLSDLYLNSTSGDSYTDDDPFYFYYSQSDYLDYLNSSFDANPDSCSNQNDLTCMTVSVDCTLDPNNSFCQATTTPACESDPLLSADDPNCAASSTPEAPTEEFVEPTSTEAACASDPNLNASDPACADSAPTVEAICPYDSSLTASDPACADSTSTIEAICPYDSSLTASDPACVEPAATDEPTCIYDPSLAASDPNCVEPAPSP